ncbi:Type II secretory pathway ATPase GspE/PulE or T4P pilus assembly pathway ATPase PilB [Nitrosomonas eutropha]|uniref:Type II secretory pathway ATPase GspE/PulE or T4P pilus assembly pathway ATPase PilB n=1 Tax=Nitrosomonas eutropha TaxID=916 RepID=A0A1I7HAD5_9PROT|nr:GspE/PulE family protein [Nitrosomonas eutropha]SFU57691.1 Type II secretory pathway ATPase GspE/PulE or T4P pilus assembly pathway ATPase PilB [Nitrosomonas eutropha]
MSTSQAFQTGSDIVSTAGISLDSIDRLRSVIDRIHAAGNIDEIMFEVSRDICEVFNADRLTIYTVSGDRASLVSRIKTGLDSCQDLKLPINEQSVAGFVALHRKIVNFRDVYDRNELRRQGEYLRFLQEVDKRTGYRTKQMLVVPIPSSGDNDLLGVVQLINNKSDEPFSQKTVDNLGEICQVLAAAFKQHRMQQLLGKTRYDQLIVNAVISTSEFELATRRARETGRDLEDVLIDEFGISVMQIGEALAGFFGVKYEGYRADRIRPLDLLKNLKREFVESNSWLPIDDGNDGLVVLTLDPERIKALRIVHQIFPKRKIIYTVCTQREFKATLDVFYGGTEAENLGGSIDDMLSNLEEVVEETREAEADEASAAADNELVKLVNRIIMDAYKMGVSDIHIEPLPGKGKTSVRFRKDGALMPYIEIPASYRNPLVTRLKIMCDLDISEKRKPQDGKIKFRKFAPLDIELRVATIPSAGGVEDVVMRILAAGEPIPLEKMGFTPANLEQLKSIISKPYGLFFVCGPTGSGKTTTLHSILKYLNRPETKIWTAEDPVEITQKGLRQVQINTKAGLTFATIMKSFLRADPDIIMVGEMRDKETTGIGIEASLTGHLVFATLHTNSAPESITRLLDMGMDPFNFSDALLGILAQRLARRLCKCKKAHAASREEIRALLTEYCEELKNIEHFKVDPDAAYREIEARWVQQYGDENGQITLYQSVGCEHCTGTGYAGRAGLHELLTATDALKKNIQEHARVAEMLTTALGDGMRTLKQDGIEKVLQGITDIHQVRAVCIK